MSEEKKDSKKCCGKKKIMIAYGFIQLGSSFVSAVALAAIAFGFCAVKKESKIFNNCVTEIVENGNSNAEAVRRQQMITSIPKKYSSFIKDVWMNQVRFNRIGKKSVNFTKILRFRDSYDFLLLRNINEEGLDPLINWWTEFKTANYDKKIRLLNTRKKKNARKQDS